MKKIVNFILTGVYIIILMILSIFLFWEAHAKEFIIDHIKTEYGHDIKQTYNNSELIKELLNIEDNDS